MKHLARCLLIGVALAIVSPAFAAGVDFSHEIAPLLKERCAKCHTGPKKEGSFSLNTRESLLKGGESGAVVTIGESDASELIKRIASDEKEYRMPPEGTPLTAPEIARLKAWIDAGIPWESGFSFAPRSYDPPLKPRHVELPPAVANRGNPIDRLIDAYLVKQKIPQPTPIDDGAFARRAYLDLIGLLPTPDELQTFQSDVRPDKRARLVDALLAQNGDYAEHWFSFWNDLLRNDYVGTGYIDGGRKQISRWLYDALVANKPYDEFARELIAPPTDASRGFIDGIKWRGEVSAAQTVEIQFAQNIGQSLLGINLKCASCHDSFIDRWKLDESYGLAAIFSQRPLEISRCDKPTGRMATASWLFPEIGQVDAKAPQPERLKQLAALMTHPDNGRFPRVIVNRLWHRLMGHGIVHPPNAMQTEPWNADLLDYLAMDLAEHEYDLKHTLALIAASQAYQGRAQVVTPAIENEPFVYAGPRAKRLTAEQFVDAVWQLTGAAPTHVDAPIVRAAGDRMVRASLVKSDFLMRSLGRPNREQVVTVRPEDLTTLEAIDLCNGQTLADALHVGARRLAAQTWDSPSSFVRWVYRFALSRDPTPDESRVLAKQLGDKITEQRVEDLLWTVLMLPEFQLVR